MLELKLYLSGMTPRVRAQLTELQAILDVELGAGYRLEVKDVLDCPEEARADAVYATPTLIKQLPEPASRIIGDLSGRERVLVGLDLRKRSPVGD